MNVGLTLVLLLTVFHQPSKAKVYWDDLVFSNCAEYFHKGTPPSGFVNEDDVRQNGGFAAPICQTYKGRTYYATLYNTQFRTPIYSAYKMDVLPVQNVPAAASVSKTWRYESQLLRRPGHLQKTMIPECPQPQNPQNVAECNRRKYEMLNWGVTEQLPGISTIKWDRKKEQKNRKPDEILGLMTSDQEANSDYKYWINVENDRKKPVNLVDAGNHYDKGHLYPNFMASFQFPESKCDGDVSVAASETKKSREATFAITNSAPQSSCLNGGNWKSAEQMLKNFMSEHCNTQDYDNHFLTGTGFEKVTKDQSGRLSKPSEKIPPIQKDKTLEAERVGVPDFFWTAVCCHSKNTNKDGFGIAYHSNGNFLESEVIPMKLEALENELSKNWLTRGPRENKQIKLFPGSNNEECYKTNEKFMNEMFAVDVKKKKHSKERKESYQSLTGEGVDLERLRQPGLKRQRPQSDAAGPLTKKVNRGTTTGRGW